MNEPVINSRETRIGSYVIAFFITVAIFFTAFLLNNYFNSQRLDSIRSIQENLSTDILSLETQFELLQERSCEGVTENTVLPTSLLSLADKLSYMEARSQDDPDELNRLKRLYSLLQIKDYLLMKKLAQKCNLNPIFILYFYSNSGDCKECESQGYVLTAISKQYPQVRIYSFDYDLDVGGLKTLIAISPLERTLPALLIDNKPYYGLQSIEDIYTAIPALQKLDAASSTATGTKKR